MINEPLRHKNISLFGSKWKHFHFMLNSCFVVFFLFYFSSINFIHLNQFCCERNKKEKYTYIHVPYRLKKILRCLHSTVSAVEQKIYMRAYIYTFLFIYYFSWDILLHNNAWRFNKISLLPFRMKKKKKYFFLTLNDKRSKANTLEVRLPKFGTQLGKSLENGVQSI